MSSSFFPQRRKTKTFAIIWEAGTGSLAVNVAVSNAAQPIVTLDFSAQED
jgi:hypothetical protein